MSRYIEVRDPDGNRCPEIEDALEIRIEKALLIHKLFGTPLEALLSADPVIKRHGLQNIMTAITLPDPRHLEGTNGRSS